MSVSEVVGWAVIAGVVALVLLGRRAGRKAAARSRAEAWSAGFNAATARAASKAHAQASGGSVHLVVGNGGRVALDEFDGERLGRGGSSRYTDGDPYSIDHTPDVGNVHALDVGTVDHSADDDSADDYSADFVASLGSHPSNRNGSSGDDVRDLAAARLRRRGVRLPGGSS